MGTARVEAEEDENKCLYPNYRLYKWGQPFCVPGDTPWVCCVSATSQLSRNHLLSHETETPPRSCHVWSLSNVLQQVCMTFSKQPSSAVARTISFTTVSCLPVQVGERCSQGCHLPGLGWAHRGLWQNSEAQKPFSFTAWKCPGPVSLLW